MELDFRVSNSSDNVYVCVQTSISNYNQKIANVRDEGGNIKIRFSNQYKRYIEKQRFSKLEIEDIESIIKNNFLVWKQKQNPLNTLTDEQKIIIRKNFKLINILLIAFQDCISDLSFLKDSGIFEGSMNELQKIEQLILSINNRVYKTVGVDSTIENGDNADKVIEFINTHFI